MKVDHKLGQRAKQEAKDWEPGDYFDSKLKGDKPRGLYIEITLISKQGPAEIYRLSVLPKSCRTFRLP